MSTIPDFSPDAEIRFGEEKLEERFDHTRTRQMLARLRALDKSQSFSDELEREVILDEFARIGAPLVAWCAQRAWQKATENGIAEVFGLVRENELPEFHSEGMAGLFKAVNAYRLDSDAAFSTYAVAVIDGEISHYLRDRARPIREPAHRQGRKDREFAPQAVNAGLPNDDALSLDEGYSAPDPSNFRASSELRADIDRILDEPPPASYGPHRAQAWINQGRAVKMLYFEGKTKSEIARELNCSTFNACHLIKRGEERLRAGLSDYAE